MNTTITAALLAVLAVGSFSLSGEVFAEEYPASCSPFVAYFDYDEDALIAMYDAATPDVQAMMEACQADVDALDELENTVYINGVAMTEDEAAALYNQMVEADRQEELQIQASHDAYLAEMAVQDAAIAAEEALMLEEDAAWEAELARVAADNAAQLIADQAAHEAWLAQEMARQAAELE